MKKSLASLCLALGIFLLTPSLLPAQQSANQSVDFDGLDDYISLTPVDFVGPASEFTLEAWVQNSSTSGLSDFRLLFMLKGPGTTLELGEANGFLHLYLQTPQIQIDFNQISTTSLRDGLCHHIALAFEADPVVPGKHRIKVYLDGTLVYATNSFSGPVIEMSSSFYVGGKPPLKSWKGTIDDIRFWNTALELSEINAYKDCILSGSFSNLLVYWTLNGDGIPGGNNQGTSTVNNSGTLGDQGDGLISNFQLTGLESNFINTVCDTKYDLLITDKPFVPTSSISMVCEGEPVHFAVKENGNNVNLIPGGAIVWEYSDNGGTWTPVNGPYFTGFAFFVPQGIILDDCSNNPSGMVERRYRAHITKTAGGQVCNYYTPDRTLNICCPVTGSITLNPAPPAVLCEGAVSVQVQLNGPVYMNTYSIQWYINGVYFSNYDNLTSFVHTGPANSPQLCFEARIQHCFCPQVILSGCLEVDPVPVCTVIDQISNNLMPLPGGTAFDYLICPGEEAELAMFGLPENSLSVWQFSFDGINWTNIGTGNPVLNTNTLPAPDPSIYNWPAGATCIYYRLECRPLHYPYSLCDILHSNTVKICLKENELLDPVIAAIPAPVCEGEFAVISLQPPTDPNVTHIQWYCGGIPCFTTPTISTMQGGLYQVAVIDGCFYMF
jgi:hypothetical protein